VRVVLSIGYAPVEKHEEPKDTDRDGLLDPADGCPTDPEDKDKHEDEDGCPDPDNDLDGLDDNDGLLDRDDQCPSEPEDLDGFEDQDGCPEEGSGKVKVTCEKIDLQDKVFFDTGSDRIQARSFELLDQVAEVLHAAKHIQKMRIEGHTDDRGNDEKNLDLSKRRAASVVRYLVDKGIDESRLDSEGYGESKPLTTNKTSAGRADNRRVEFIIVEQDSSCSK
jgi:outer membrane protein OmpA-like peptidoglycan-associated protein